MTLAIGFITPGNLSYVAIQFDRLAWLVVALMVALAGLLLDHSAGLAPVGLVALGPALLALAISAMVLAVEIIQGVAHES